MKIAALGDIHGNFQALITVLDDIDRWKPDLVLVLGDIINRGPRSRDCLRLILERSQDPDWHVIRGNHEGYVLLFEDPEFPRTGPEFELRRVIHWTHQSLTQQDLRNVIELPEETHIRSEENDLIRCFHASLAGDRIGIYPDTTVEKLHGLADPGADLFLVGHTHQPFINLFGESLLINVGSVGLPFDGDIRPSYGRMVKTQTGWQGEIVRLEYDQEKAEDDYLTTGFIPEGGGMANLVLAELQLGWPQLSKFLKRYEHAVLNEAIKLDDAVKEMLLNPNIERRKAYNNQQ